MIGSDRKKKGNDESVDRVCRKSSVKRRRIRKKRRREKEKRERERERERKKKKKLSEAQASLVLNERRTTTDE